MRTKLSTESESIPATPESKDYQERFSRNIGVLTLKEQTKLSVSRVGIAGMGGVGGAYAVTMARLGIGGFHLADFDCFEAANFNRQYGATIPNLGKRKVLVMKETVLSIHPDAKVTTFDEGISAQNIDAFLSNVDLVMDGLDFYALDARRLLFAECEKRGIHVVTSGPIGMTTTLHVFGPKAMRFEDYFDFKSCKTQEERIIAFAVGVAPAMLNLGQVDLNRVDVQRQKAPSIGTAIQGCAGLACTEAFHILLGRRKPMLAPRYLQFCPSSHRLRKGYLFFGNRHPLQRFKRWLMKRLFSNRTVNAGSP